MSSYIDHKSGGYPEDGSLRGGEITHSWADFTAQRLRWIYDDDRARDNFLPSKNADLRAWLDLGKGRAA